MQFSQIVNERRSVKSYDSDKNVSASILKEIFEEVSLSPTSYNLQHQSFVVVNDPELKSKLKEAAWGQQQVEDSSVTILVSGKLDAYKDAPKIFDEVSDNVKDQLLPMIEQFYDGNEQLQRDEAIRSASLAAMTLMYSAKSRGLDTCPMIGFDPQKVTELLNVPSNYFPVMLIVLGYGNGDSRPRAYRRPLGDTVRMNSMDGPGLQ